LTVFCEITHDHRGLIARFFGPLTNEDIDLVFLQRLQFRPWCSPAAGPFSISVPTVASCLRSARQDNRSRQPGVVADCPRRAVLVRLCVDALGRYVFAVGGNRHAANLTGVPVRRIICSV
jgi:hypothetical protein